MKTVILGLGNELIGDDAVGILAARELKKKLNNKYIDIKESSVSGFYLLEELTGYDKAVIIDSVVTGKKEVGKIHKLTMSNLAKVKAPSAHWAGLPEVFEIAKRLKVHFPTDIRIFAVEVKDPFTIGKEISEKVKKSISGLVRMVCMSTQ